MFTVGGDLMILTIVLSPFFIAGWIATIVHIDFFFEQPKKNPSSEKE